MGSHVSIMTQEILETLKPQNGEVGVDLTLGFGGHTLSLLEKCADIKIFGFDQDPLEFKKTSERIESKGFSSQTFEGIFSNFSNFSTELKKRNIHGVDFILGDLGLSSMQIDRPERGFSVKHDAPLDLRMNSEEGRPARDILAEISTDALLKILREYGDEPCAEVVAKDLKAAANRGQLKTTFQFRDVVLASVKKFQSYPDPKKAVARNLQAVRIYVNAELESLVSVLEQIPTLLKPRGRVAFLTFHSGEDRLVKKFFQQGQKEGVFLEIGGPQAANPEEVAVNRRARSAKLRWGIKS